MDSHPVLERVVCQQGEHGLEVFAILKYGLAVVATLDHVVQVAWQGQAWKAGHGRGSMKAMRAIIDPSPISKTSGMLPRR
jgi:hypothetical protein